MECHLCLGRDSEEEEDEEDVDDDDRVKRRRNKKRKIAEQDRDYREAEEHFGPHEEIQVMRAVWFLGRTKYLVGRTNKCYSSVTCK